MWTLFFEENICGIRIDSNEIYWCDCQWICCQRSGNLKKIEFQGHKIFSCSLQLEELDPQSKLLKGLERTHPLDREKTLEEAKPLEVSV